MHIKVLSGIENIYNSCIKENIVSLHFYRENDCMKVRGEGVIHQKKKRKLRK